jgi:hypothetical protein
MNWLGGLIFVALIAVVVYLARRKKAAPPVAVSPPPVVVPPVVVPPVVVEPPKPPVAPPTPAKLTAADYLAFAFQWGETRAIIEARKAPLPPGWSWEDAYASKHITSGVINASNPGDSGHDRASLYFPAPGASAIANIAGHPGDRITHGFPVPAGWNGTIKIGVYGQRGSDPIYGGRIDDMTFTVRDGAGRVLGTNHGSDVMFEIQVAGDISSISAEAIITPTLKAGGVGYMQVNVYPK